MIQLKRKCAFCFIPFIVDNRIIQMMFQSFLTNIILHYLERIKRILIRNKTYNAFCVENSVFCAVNIETVIFR